MISTLLKTTLIGLTLSISTFSISQGGTVTSVVATNPPATACTNTLLTVSGTHNYGGYTYTGATVTPVGNNLTISLNYTFGIGIAVITPFVQSVNIGMVPAANYTVTTNITVNGVPAGPYTSLLNVVNCCGAVSSFTSSATSVCVGDSINLTNTSTGSTSQTWTDGSGFTYTTVDFGVLTTVPGPITFNLVVSDGTCSDSVQQTVNVLAVPTITSITPSATQVCAGELFTLSGVSTGGTTTSDLKWFKGGSQIGFGSTIQAVASGSGFQSYIHTVDNSSCSTSDSVIIEVLSVPTIDSFNVVSEICLGETISTTSSSTGASILGWYLNGVSDGTGSMYSYTPPTAGSAVIKLLASNGVCVDSATQNVTINALPTVDLGPDTVYCIADITLDAGSGFTDYLWNDASTASTLVVSALGTYSVTVTDANNCMNSDTVIVTSCLGEGEMVLSNNSAYPNPTSGNSTIELGEKVDQISISVVNVLGQVVLTKEYSGVEKIDLDLTSVKKGVYVVNLETENGRNEIRLIKE